VKHLEAELSKVKYRLSNAEAERRDRKHIRLDDSTHGRFLNLGKRVDNVEASMKSLNTRMNGLESRTSKRARDSEADGADLDSETGSVTKKKQRLIANVSAPTPKPESTGSCTGSPEYKSGYQSHVSTNATNLYPGSETPSSHMQSSRMGSGLAPAPHLADLLTIGSLGDLFASGKGVGKDKKD